MRKNNSIFSKLNRIYILLAFFVLSIIFLLCFNIKIIILALPILFLSYLLSKKEIKYFPFILFIIMFLIRLIVINNFNTPPASDFGKILYAAQDLLNHVNHLNNDRYFIYFAYQTGPVLYDYFFLKIYNSVYFLKILNCLFSSLNCLLIYELAKKFTSKTSAQVSSLLYGFLIFPIFFNTVLSNQIPASTFFYLAILIYFNSKKSLKNYVFCALLLCLGNFLRSEGIIFICAFIGLYLLNLLSKKADFKMHIGTLLLVIIYFLGNISLSTAVKISHLNNAGLSNNFPEWKFILGLNTKTYGLYNNEDQTYLDSKKEAQKEVKRRLKNLNIKTYLKLSFCKTKIMWHGNDLYWTFNGLKKNEYNLFNHKYTTKEFIKLLDTLNSIIYCTAFFLMLVGIFKSYKDNNINNHILFYLNILALNFIAYSLIEIQPRYIYLLEISIFILSSLGLENLPNLKLKKDFKTLRTK